MSEVTDFCARHYACTPGWDYASQFQTLAEVYASLNQPSWLVWMLSKQVPVELETKSPGLGVALYRELLPVYEKAFPDNNLPRLILEAGVSYLENPMPTARKNVVALGCSTRCPFGRGDCLEHFDEAGKILTYILTCDFCKGDRLVWLIHCLMRVVPPEAGKYKQDRPGWCCVLRTAFGSCPF